MYKIEDGLFTKDGVKTKTISVAVEGSDDWNRKQNNSMEEYEETHLGNYPEHIQYCFSIYNLTINSNILKRSAHTDQINVLDVGCGISKNHPPYFDAQSHPNVNYIGLDPFAVNMDRDYLFVNSTIERIDELIEPNSIDLFCFSTSLDHIEDLEAMVQKMRVVAKKNAKVVILQLVRDSQITANDSMYYHLNNLNSGSFLGLNKKIKYYNRLRLLVNNILKERKRVVGIEHKMANGIAMDDLHFHYFTIESLKNFLSSKVGPLEFKKIIKPHRVMLTVNNLD